ncbi:MAG: DUF748 domain-containing protein [Halioglobus sp.]
MLRKLLMLYCAYLLVGLLLILPALNFLTPWYIEKTLGRKFQSELILFNPFTLSVEIRGAELAELDASSFIAFSSARANLSIESLWAQGWVFDAIAVESLSANIHRLRSGDFNFSDLLATDEPTETRDTTSTIPGITIHHLFFHAETINITDDAREVPFSTHYQGLEIAVSDLSTVIAEGKPYQLSVTGESGGQLSWQGTVSIPNGHSEGYLSLTGLSLKPISRFIAPWVRFHIAEGQVSIEGQYGLDWAGEFTYAIEKAKVALDNIDITPQDPAALPDTGVKLDALSLTGLAIKGEQERANIESIAVKGLAISGWSEGQVVSLSELFAPRSNAAPEETEASEGDSAWSVGIAETTVRDSRLRWQSEFTSPPELFVSPLNITVLDVQWPPSGDSRLQADLAVNELAALKVEAVLSLESGDGTIHYDLDGLPVSWFNPNLPSGVNANIGKGKAEVDGELSLAGFAPSSASLNGRIDDFSIEVEEAENAITAWESVRWNQLNVDFIQQKVVLSEFFIDGYSGRLHIYEDGSINTQNALMEDTKPSPADNQDKPWAFEIPSIRITDSALDFMDESLPIAFRTVIGDINGEIRDISSDPDQVARVDIKGSVDSYAPVMLAGSARPFATPPALDLGMNFDGVDLARLTPYSSTYAGYAIDRGILNLDLEYKLEDDQLAGHNQIVIRQLKLGEKIESNQAADLPVDLAIALLTDMNGVIDLAVPVSGNVDDPEFSLGSVIFSALGNIITKAVTAPFSLLASLVSSEEDLQRITFASGSIELDEMARTKLGDLQAALTQRPELVLVIRGRIHPRADREYLQLAALKSELLASGLPEASWEGKDEQWSQAIDARYKSLAINEADVDAPEPLSHREKLEVILSKISIPESLLQTLAEDRAVAVKRYLVNEAQLPADRAVIDTFDITDEENIFSGVEMKIDT